jgi:hypothetical protein
MRKSAVEYVAGQLGGHFKIANKRAHGAAIGQDWT